ncbi:MAG TPA: ABC transporter permease [Candidatus Binatia bacterium]|nr:ABC transporter permease [Candidatus Binatia bacterium]
MSLANYIALYTLFRREMVRTYKILNQVVWPPIISTLLYVFVFGLALGSRIRTVQGVSYAEFLIPGLIMLQVIDGAYGEASSSVFQGRFQHHIEELLIAPMSALEIVLGFVLAGIVRAFVVALLITILGAVFVHTLPHDWVMYVGMITIVAILFASLGVIFGLMASKFDDVASLTTFAITPLVFVGGVFTSIQFLPPAVRHASLFNPMFYMIDAFRFAYTGTSDIPLRISTAVVIVLAVVAFAVALRLVHVGFKLRT